MGAGASVRREMVYGVSLAIIALREPPPNDDTDDTDADDISIEAVPSSEVTFDYDYEVDDDANWIAWTTESD